MTGSSKILVVLTSHDKLGDTGKPTGWYLSELAHPYDILITLGFGLTLASPKGGPAPLDPSSIEAAKSANDATSASFLAEKPAPWESTAPLSSFLGRASEFDAIFFPGGHGPMFDLATDSTSQALIREFVDAGKVVAAVCHGPAALVGVRELLKGKRVTGFSNDEERAVGLDGAMPFLLEDRLWEAVGQEGGYEKATEPWGEKVVVDGKLITGQNPASAKGVGEAIVKAVRGG
ncbi:class I glutamine amidotransferase-like protein [Parathielavia appendiculata]|uniref:D-lactate dehydratase n=1 Tax=Parathielavia appendiculata TaxID=2587402 RepID=A0AAN6U4T4_9PEZI|nr:class I glutamine amidotransferase-like protein [Parathielavia appendiculata]